MDVPPAFFNVNVEELTVPASMDLLNVALTAVPIAIFCASLRGVVELTFRGVGPPPPTVKTTSTQ
jgi:hypothetical protein